MKVMRVFSGLERVTRFQKGTQLGIAIKVQITRRKIRKYMMGKKKECKS